MIKYLALSCLLLFLFSSCFSRKKTRSSSFEYGMARPEVLEHIHKRSELIVAEFNRPRGHLVVYQYGLVGRMEARQDRYYLYFMNDTLIRKSAPEELEEGAAIAVREYYRNKKIREREMKEQEEAEQEMKERKMRKQEMKEKEEEARDLRRQESKNHQTKERGHSRRRSRKTEAE